MTSTRLPSIDEKVAFLSRPDAYPHRPSSVSVRETHMSWVFLAGDLVYKLKKPVAYPFLDFTTLEARERNCREELRLNARLAENVYLDVVSLHADSGGGLSFEAVGSVADWLVWMRRLPAGRMLDALIDAGSVDVADVKQAAEKLARFYAACPPLDVTAAWVMARFRWEHEEDLRLLSDGRFALEAERTRHVLGMMSTSLDMVFPFIEARAAAQAYVEGHGDLRPEHVCLVAEPVFIDCLEFNRDLRILDPFDEICYLGLECERLGAGWIGAVFLSSAREKLGRSVPEPLLCFYRSARALLRARLALAHLTEPEPRTPEKWEPRARQYIRLAEQSLEKLVQPRIP
jgi:aminoglycoside phosphotransferase family enzyme